MIVTRKCHRCGKKNRFDKSNIEGPIVCARCGGRIRRTEQNLSFIGWVLLNLKGYIVYHRGALFAGVLVAGVLGAGTYYWADLVPKEPDEIVDQTLPRQRNAEPLPAPEPPEPVRTRQPRHFDSEPVWTNPDSGRAFLVPDGSHVVTSSLPAQFIAVDGTIHELKSGATFGGFDTEGALSTALSLDGNWFAVASADSEGRATVSIYPSRSPAASGATIQCGHDADQLGIVRFVRGNRLLIQSKLVIGSKLGVWGTNGSELTEFETASFGPNAYAVAPDGETIAIASASAIDIYELNSGKRVSLMAPVETGFPMSMCGGLAFSPDGKELACLLHMDRFIIWDTEDGTVTVNHTLERRVTEQTDANVRLQWLPDGRGWLLNGSLLLLSDPLSIIWLADSSVPANGYVIDQNHVLVRDASEEGVMRRAVAFPWAEIDQVRESLQRPLLQRGDTIEIIVTHDDRESEVTRRFSEALAARCEAMGLVVGTECRLKLVMEYTAKRGSRKPFTDGEYTDIEGRVVFPTEIHCQFRLRHAGSGIVVWSREISTDGGIPPLGPTTTATLEARAIAAVAAQIDCLNIPSRILDDSKVTVPLRRTTSAVSPPSDEAQADEAPSDKAQADEAEEDEAEE
jgi:WD40 repeat protein